MPAGGKRPGAGRPKGVPNKVTQDVRQALAKFAEDKADDFRDWIDRVAESDPGKAADLYLKAIEYHIPKLARSEGPGDEGQHVLEIRHKVV